MKECKSRISLKHKNILQLYMATEASDDTLCGDFNKITLYFEYYFHDFE